MRIFIMRHGEASMAASSDATRQLTSRGITQSNTIGQRIQTEVAQIDQALVSPYIRARQTFEQVSRYLTIGDVAEMEELTPGGDAEKVVNAIFALAAQGLQTVLIVSHLPLVGYLVADLCPGVSVPMFSTGSVAAILFNESSMKGELLSIVTPNC